MAGDKARIEKERKVITYAEFWTTSRHLLERGRESPEGSAQLALASLMFTAFAFEAFLNHLGERLFSTWQDLESLRPRGKLNVLAERLQLAPDYGALPWQIVPELIGFRNKVAHGKNALLREEHVVPLDRYEELMHKFLLAPWEEYATLDQASHAKGRGSVLTFQHPAAAMLDCEN